MSQFKRYFSAISKFISVIFVNANAIFAHKLKILVIFLVILTELANLWLYTKNLGQ